MILVTGATGLNGSELLRRLSAKGIPSRALVRSMAKAQALTLLPNVEVVEGDMARPDSLTAPLHGVERAMLISSSDPAMVDVQSSFIEAARRAGVEHVVKLSGIIPELDSPFRFARMHAESDIAEVAVAILTTSGHEGKVYPLTGPEALTMPEVAEKLSAATGNAIRYVDVPPEKARKARLAAGLPQYLADGLDELFAERRKSKESKVWPTIEEVFGWQPASFDQFARRNAAIFRGEQAAPAV